jgi:hypothetical protein
MVNTLSRISPLAILFLAPFDRRYLKDDTAIMVPHDKAMANVSIASIMHTSRRPD